MINLEALVPRISDKYRIKEELGRGGMGVVYLAQHIELKRDGALKLMNQRYASDPAAVERFRNEARVVNQIDDKHVVRVYDAGQTQDGQRYIEMEYVPGSSLRQLLRSADNVRQAPLDPLRAIDIASQVCEALAAAHRREIIHRDIKPDNILIVKDTDLAKVVDFGLAKELHGSAPDAQLSDNGRLLCTPQYCSPEQARGTKGNLLDARSDIYSLGVVLYEMLVGQPPFRGENHADVLYQQQTARPPSLPPDLPKEIVKVTMKALNKDPNQRFSSADEMREQLEEARAAIRRLRDVRLMDEPTTVVGRPAQAPIKEEEEAGPSHFGRPADTAPSRRSFYARWGRAIIALIVLILIIVIIQTKQDATKAAETTKEITEAETSMARGDYRAAIPKLQDVLRQDPQNARAQNDLDIAQKISEAETSMADGDYRAAIPKLRDVLRQDPQNARAQNDLDIAAEKDTLGK